MQRESSKQAVFTDAFRQQLNSRFGLGDEFVRRLFAKRLAVVKTIDTWEDLVDPGRKMSSAYVHFAMSNVVRGRQACDRIMKRTGIIGGASLDVGSAYGGMVVAFAEKGFNATGVEIDEFWCETGNINCEDHGLSQRIRREDFLSADFDGKFDIITCNDVIEHVLEPRRALEKMTSMLNPGGALYLSIPNARSWDHAIRDGHYGVFAMNLLDHFAARSYYDLRCKSSFLKDYSCGEFYSLDWYLELLKHNGCTRIEFVHTGPREIPGPDQFNEIIEKLAVARRNWNRDGLPEILADLIESRFDRYMTELKGSYDTLDADCEEEFYSDYLDSFWTLIAQREGGGRSLATTRADVREEVTAQVSNPAASPS